MQAKSRETGAHGRCISSLQVTYHEEFHKPSRGVTRPPLASLPSTYSSSGPVDQSLEESCEDLRSSQELHFFHPPHSTTHLQCVPAHVNTHGTLPPNQPAPPLHPPPPPPPPPLSWPTGNPLYGLEDGLRHKINVEIENFRASIQEVMCEQFASHRQQACAGVGCSIHNSTKVERQEAELQMIREGHPEHHPNSSQDDSIHSAETSADSGLGESVEATPPLEEQLSLSLIRLQTLAAIISTNLQRTEYSSS